MFSMSDFIWAFAGYAHWSAASYSKEQGSLCAQTNASHDTSGEDSHVAAKERAWLCAQTNASHDTSGEDGHVAAALRQTELSSFVINSSPSALQEAYLFR